MNRRREIQDFSVIWENITVGKKHGGFNEFILFASLTFNFKLDENAQKNELTLMNDGNDANSTRANSKWLYYVTNVYGFSFCTHLYVGIYYLFINPLLNTYLFHLLKFIDYRIPRLTFEIFACTKSFFPMNFRQTDLYTDVRLFEREGLLYLLFFICFRELNSSL